MTIKEVGKEASKTTRTYPVTMIMDQPEGIKILPGMAGRSTAENRALTAGTAVVSTSYPGASPEQVELEVTDRIELAIQEMAEIDYLES